MQLAAPYLLFIGDATDELSIKMARGAADWRPELCVGEMYVEGCTVSTGLPQLTIADAVAKGAKSLVLGFANSGGVRGQVASLYSRSSISWYGRYQWFAR